MARQEMKILDFFYKKTIFLPEPQFSQYNARNYAEIFLIFVLTFISLFSLILYLIRFNNNNRHIFIKNGNTKGFKLRKKPKIYSIL